MLKRFALILLVLSLTAASFSEGVPRKQRWAVMLKDPAITAHLKLKSRAELRSASALSQRAKLEAAHSSLRQRIRERGIAITGETRVLANAMFVAATEQEARELRNLPEVGGVVRLPKITRKLENAKSTAEVNTTWSFLGGINGAGDNVKVAIIDTGIDNTHPAFANSPLPMPPGFPRVSFPEDQQFTNNKVVVARSYVRTLADDGIEGGNPGSDDQIQLTRPDDYTARDRVGHGTAMAMIVAGHQVNTPQGQIAGVAPGAWLGNYKVFGSPGINDGTFADVVILALEDAFTDGMDIAALSLGAPAVWGPLDVGADCNNDPGVPCDPFADAAGNAANNGMLVVVAAGNSGDTGSRTPSFATIESPGTHPDVLTVGALINTREWYRALEVAGGPNGSAGPGLYEMAIGTTPIPGSAINAPLRDVRSTGNNGLACAALPGGSMNGAIAFIARGSGECTFATKATNAANAGAVAVIFYRTDGSNDLFSPGGLDFVTIPAALIGASDGSALRNFLDQQNNRPASFNPALRNRPADNDADNNGSQDGILTSFSSRGPDIGFPFIKPEITAVGENIYTATQNFDPNSSLYDASRYTVVDGTSFSVPLVAGVAALVLDSQALPFYDADRLKSALVNSANDLGIFDRNLETGVLEPAYNVAMGGGEVNAFNATDAVVTMSPQTLDFGEVTNDDLAQGIEATIRITNNFTVPLRMSLVREPYAEAVDNQSSVVWTFPSEINVPAGGFQNVTFRLTGTAPNILDFYDGVILLEGSGDPSNNIPDVKIPYLYIAGDFSPCNMIPLAGSPTGIVNEIGPFTLAVKVTDCRGLPIDGVDITWTTKQGTGQILSESGNTDGYGIVEAEYRLGPETGVQVFEASIAGTNLTLEFPVGAIADPVVNPGGIVEGAGFLAGRAVAPGSFVSVFGVNMAGGLLNAGLVPLPIALGNVSVSIDTRDRTVSVPGSLIFVSPNQLNFQLPWELAGKNGGVLKVNIGDISTQVRDFSIATHSPGIFQYTEAGSSTPIIAAQIFRNGQRLGLHSSSRRAQSGDVLELYANGLGPIQGGNPPTGAATPTDRAYVTESQPTVTINGIPAQVQFSGLAGSFVALYQVNVQVPNGLAPGEYDIVISIGGVSSKAGRILIQ